MKHYLTVLFLIAGTMLAAQTRVMGSTLPVAAVTRAVLKGVPDVSVEVLLPGIAGCPHDYSLTPADMKRLTGIQILVVNGGGMEHFLEGAVERVSPKAKIIEAADGILPEEHKHACGKEHCHHHHQHMVNEHILAAPGIAAKAVKSVGAQFISLPEFSKSSVQILKNTEDYSGQLIKIAEEYSAFADVLPAGKKAVLVQHSLFDYLAKEAGFEVKGHIFEHDLQEPSASEAAKLLRKIKKENIFAIIAEPGKKSRMTEMLAREGGIPVIYLNANLKTDSPDELLQIFTGDLEILKKAVK